MRSILLMTAAACALAGCKANTGTTTITSNSQTGEVTSTSTGSGGQPLGLTPGKWEVMVAVSDFKMAGMAGANPHPVPVTNTACISPEQAAKGPGDLLKQAKLDCTATSSNYAGGAIAVDMTCKLPGDSVMHNKTTGTYTPTSMTTDAQVEMTGKMAMSQKVHTEARRIGDCPG